MNESAVPSRKAVILGPSEGCAYPMGRISAVFKADEAETESRYSISEWLLEPHTRGPGTHSHPEDDIFYVIEGTMSVLVGEAWTHATRGFSFLSLVASPTTSRTAETYEPECLTCQYRVRSSHGCVTSRGGLPKIRKMQASNHTSEVVRQGFGFDVSLRV